MSDLSAQMALPAAGFLLILSSVLVFNKNQQGGLWLLLAGALLLRLYMAQLDPFLNLWDEKFHALVAKNMMADPLKPMLYVNPVLPYDFTDWTRNHIWLHKQPLFMGQIALFFKLFGVNEFVLRLPSVLMTTVVVFFIYRIGKLVAGVRTGFYGAVLFAVSYYCLEYCSGVIGMDHNDTAFIFYVTGSIWAWAEYQTSGNRWWLPVIGLFVGCAILNKWLTGLLVFSGWGLAVLFSNQRFKLRPYLDMAISLAVAVAVFLPWQFYISAAFPEVSAYEYAYNTKHMFEVVEGHAGTAWFHIQNLPDLYGPVLPYLIPVGLICLFFELKTTAFRVAILTYVLLIYFFFSVVVTTKVQNYVFVVGPLIFLSLGALLCFLEHLLKHRIRLGKASQFLFLTLLLLMGWFTLNYDRIRYNHFTGNYYGVGNFRAAKEYNTKVYKQLPGMFWGQQHVVFNLKPLEHIDLMFYTNLTGYDRVPSREDLELLKTKGLKIAVFDDVALPDYVKADSTIYKIPVKLL